MAGYSITAVEDIPDVSGDYPGEIRIGHRAHRRRAGGLHLAPDGPGTGGKGSYGHRHRTQEELIFVISGTVEVKLEDEVIEVGPGHVVRISSSLGLERGPEDAVLCVPAAGRRRGERGRLLAA